jgi:nucleoside-diphosphate-sugar epimerase
MRNKQNIFITNDCIRSYSGAHKQLQNLKGKTLLITGGTGFMGSWVCEIVHYMNEVHNMDITLFLMARNQTRFEQNLPHIKDSKKIKFIYSDVRGNIVIPKMVNYIIHAAANPDSRFHASQPFESMTTVAEGTSTVFQAASRLSNLDNILNVSSSAVYSKELEKDEKFSEDITDNYRDNELSNYFSQANIYSETLCAAARSELRLPIVTIRPFTFCGPYQSIDSPWAINNFINDAINKRPIRIHNDGEALRSYMYGSDLAVWLLVILLHAKNGQIYNVGNSKGYLLKDIAEKVASYFSSDTRIMLNTSLVPNSKHSILLPDVTKSEQEFGLSIFTDIDTSVEKSVQWYKNQFNYVE